MSTIPSKPHAIFHLDVLAGEHSVESGTAKAFESEGDMVIHCPDVDKAAILTKAQAMAFFDLVERPAPRGTLYKEDGIWHIDPPRITINTNQVMKALDLVPRYNPDEEMGAADEFADDPQITPAYQCT